MSSLGAVGLVNMAGIPEMNLFAEGKSFMAAEELLSPAQVASALGHFLATESDEMGSSSSNIVLNLEHCLLTTQEALQTITRVSHHGPAYGQKLVDADAKALETFKSMHGGSDENSTDAEGCTWYGSVDFDQLPLILPELFGGDDKSYWQDWIGFFVVCVQADKRTVSYIIGADTD
jgi:hypothetical protein